MTIHESGTRHVTPVFINYIDEYQSRTGTSITSEDGISTGDKRSPTAAESKQN